MIDLRKPLCLVMKSAEETAFFSNAFRTLGFGEIVAFDDIEVALAAILEFSYDFFVIRMEMARISGLVLIQKMYASGRYGHETHLFIADKIDQNIMNVLAEFDINYVLSKPFNFQRIEQKFQYMQSKEKDLAHSEKLFRQARLDWFGGRMEKAEAILIQLRTKPDTACRALVLSGDIKLRRGNYASARDYYQQAAALAPDSAVAVHKIADSYVKEGNFAKAAEICSAAVSVNPWNIRLLENAGLSYFEIGDKEKTQQAIASIRQIDQRNKVSSEVESRIFIQEGRFEQLIDALSVSHSEEDLVSFLNNEGVKMSRNGDYGNAINMYSQCLAKMGKNRYRFILFYNMAASYKKMGDRQQALKLLNMALEINPAYDKALEAVKQLQETSTD